MPKTSEPGDDERGGGAPTLVELLDSEASDMESIARAHAGGAVVTLMANANLRYAGRAAALRAAADRLEAEMIAVQRHGNDPVAMTYRGCVEPPLLRINGGPPSALRGQVAGQGTESQSESGPSAPTPAPVTGMEPGQRCTRGKHDHVRGIEDRGHFWTDERERQWRDGVFNAMVRCNYIEPPHPSRGRTP